MTVGGHVPLPRMREGGDPTAFSQRIGNRIAEGIDNYALTPYLAEVGFFEDPSFEKYVEGARLYNQNSEEQNKYQAWSGLLKSAAPLIDDSFEALRDGYEAMIQSFKARRGSKKGAKRLGATDDPDFDEALEAAAAGFYLSRPMENTNIVEGTTETAQSMLLPRMQEGTGPGGVSPELFSPAEFMGSPLNEMAQAPGFFPQGNFGGGPSPSENAENEGILSGFADEEEMVDEVMPFQFPYTQELFDAAKTEALKLFDQGFKELMAIFQAETAAGGVAAEEIEMTLDEELEVIEGQAEAQVKEMMDLPEEVDLIPAEVVENYRQKAQTMLFSPEMGAEPMMEEIPRMQTAGVVGPPEPPQGPPVPTLQERQLTDPADELKSLSEDYERRLRAEEKRRRDQAQTDFEAIDIKSYSQTPTNFQPEKDLIDKARKQIDEIKDIARIKGEAGSYLSPAVSTMGGKWIEALLIKPKMGRLAGREAGLKETQRLDILDMEIAKREQQEDQAIKAGDAQLFRALVEQNQKFKNTLSDTVMGELGSLYEKTLTEFGDIRTKQIAEADPYGVEEARKMRSMQILETEIKKFPNQLTAKAMAALKDLGIETVGQQRLDLLLKIWKSISENNALRGSVAKRNRWKEETKDENMPIPGEKGFVNYVLSEDLDLLFPEDIELFPEPTN